MVVVDSELITGTLGVSWEYTLDGMPIYYRASYTDFTYPFTPRDSLS